MATQSSAGPRPSRPRPRCAGRRSLPAICAALAGLYVASLLLAGVRRFFELTPPNAGMVLTAVLASALAVGALARCGYSVRVASDSPEPP
jgi:hypothetical protein